MSTSEIDLGGDSTIEGHQPESPPTRNLQPPRTFRPLRLRLHFYAGILVGPFILIAAVTGALYAIAPTVERVLYDDVLTVDPTATTPLSLTEQSAVARAAYPDLVISGMRPAVSGSDSTRVYFTDPSLGEDTQRAVFVDPYSGEVLGSEPAWFGYLPFSTWLDGFHRHLQLGEPGRLYSEFAASWLWLVALAGLALWIGKFRTDRRRGRGRLVTVDRSLRGRARRLNWHGATGVWILLGALFLSATGITWSTYAGAHVSDLRAAMQWQRPQLDTALTDTDLTGAGSSVSAHAEHAHAGATGTVDVAAIDFDAVVASAAAGGVQAPLEITLPSEAGQAVAVTEVDKPYRLTTDAAAVHPVSLSITGTVEYDKDYSLIAKLADWGIRGHMGSLFGLLNQLLLVLVAAGLITVTVLGYRMWWQRRPTRGSALAFGRAPRRGGIRGVGPATAIAVVAGAIVVGWLLPLLGLGLVAFLAIDLVVAVVTTRRRPTTAPAAARERL